ncbi:MAG: HAMP domain-containing protein [Phycisphaerales bacterium]|nr:HAMP domain-containing protein [Phycisphaerales bacterium]
MPLTRKLLVLNLAILAGIGMLCGLLIWGVHSLARDVRAVTIEYEELRLVDRAMLHASVASHCLSRANGAPEDNTLQISQALDAIKAFRLLQFDHAEDGSHHEETELTLDERINSSLQTASASLASGSDEEAISAITMAIDDLAALKRQTDVSFAAIAAERRASASTTIAMLMSAIIAGGAAIASLIGYWAVMRPLRRLQEGVRTVSEGEFGARLAVERDPEFASLVVDFNRMTAELADLYSTLERRVADKSRELVRSERLASVGFLAAGVAHEINNPLGIISGYAELSSKWLEGDPEPPKVADARQALETIREEAFRCKQITRQLLSMSRMDDGSRATMSLAKAAAAVVDMVGVLPRHSEHKVVFAADPEPRTLVVANESEIKQVLLNLIVNAIEAVEPRSGRVEVSVRRLGAQVEAIVTDNGMGMSPEVLEHVFEPFYSGRGRDGRRGTGLGLSVSFAIVESHNGRLEAASEGPGQGSTFRLILPAVQPEESNE